MFESRPTFVLDIWINFLSIDRLTEGIGDICDTFWVRCVLLMAHVRIIGVVEVTGGGGGYRSSRRDGGCLYSSV